MNAMECLKVGYNSCITLPLGMPRCSIHSRFSVALCQFHNHDAENTTTNLNQRTTRRNNYVKLTTLGAHSFSFDL